MASTLGAPCDRVMQRKRGVVSDSGVESVEIPVWWDARA